MKLFQFIKNVFSEPSSEVKAQRELEEAKRSYLEACTGREYAEAMVSYHQARIERLEDYLTWEHKK
jgi:hypothetical protein